MGMNLPLATPSIPNYLDHLNPPQRDAVETLDGPLLVLAGAGTGKTRVLVTRLAHLLKSGKCWPSQILAVTFTNKAAGEMKERVSTLMGGQSVEGWWLGTFHALSARMLRAHAEKVGLTPSFTIIDDDDQARLLKQLAEAENIDTKKYPPRLLLDYISRWKDKGRLPNDINVHDAGDLAHGKLPLLYRQYQDRLRTLNVCDFGDLLLHMITILKDPKYADVLADYHRKFRYLMVDEYQDTNTAQYLWLRLLARGSNNICCVGDDDQSIYGWRGAEISNILRFEQDFPGAKIIRLEQNYRSTGHILAAASTLIDHNHSRLGKTLWSDAGLGEKVRVEAVWDGETEARDISDTIETLNKQGEKLTSMAILVRTGFQMRAFEDRFLQIGLPYRVFGGPRFYEREESRDALAYFRVVVQPHDDLAFERIINKPKRGLGDSTLQILHQHARAQGISLYTAVEHLITGTSLKPKVRDTLARLMQDFGRWRSLLSGDNHDELAGMILDESGYTAMWQADKSPDAPGRLDNLKELVGTIGDYPSLPAFLDHVALVMENASNAQDDAVSLMTLHAAKGLEFASVFLPGWEDGLFPSARALDAQGMEGLEEERRLAYVGMTRAKTRAVITCAGSRRQYGTWVQNLPSRFIGELPDDHVIMRGERGTSLSQYDQGRQGRRFAPSDDWPGDDTEPATKRPPEDDDNPFPPGARVHHDDFGTGTVIHVSGHKLDILFDDGQNRRILAGFVEAI